MIDSTVRARQSFALNLARLLSIILVLCLGGYLLFVNLGVMYIADYDEARHGANAYEMIRNNDYIMHTYAGEPDYWNLKPPLSYWSIALSYHLFGYNSFALRFFSALSTLLAMAAVACWTWRKHGYLPALIASVIFVCTTGLYANHFARFGDADSQYQLFFTLSMLCMLMSRRDFRWFYGSAIGFTLAFMLKASHAFLIPVICFAYLILTGRLRELSLKRILTLLAIGLAPIAIWAVARYLRDGMTFFQSMFSEDVSNRLGKAAIPEVATTYNGVLGALWYYVGVILPMKTPIIIVLAIIVLCAIACIVRRAKLSRECADTVIGASLWLWIPIIAFSLMETMYPWYIYSAFAALPVLAAAMTRAAMDSGMKRAWINVCACAAVVALCVTVYPTFISLTNREGSHTYQNMLDGNLDRDMDSGTHAYIQYVETNDDGEPKTDWMQGSLLKAYFAGDVVCLPGGAEAFEADEEAALLLIGKSEDNADAIDNAMGYAMLRDENYNVCMFEK